MPRKWMDWRIWLVFLVALAVLPLMVRAGDPTAKGDAKAGSLDDLASPPLMAPGASLEDMVRSMEQKMDQMIQSPFGSHGRLPRWFDDDFRAFPNPVKGAFGWGRSASQAKSNITEKGDQIIVTIDLPGHDKKSIDLRIKDQALILKSERKSVTKEDKDDKLLREEISYGSFTQVFELPRKVLETQAKAVYDNGVLTVTVPVDLAAPSDADGIKIPIE